MMKLKMTMMKILGQKMDGIYNDHQELQSPESLSLQGQDELIKKIHEKFDCVSKPHRWFLYFYTI